MEIYKPYNYRFFFEKYKSCHESMWRKYLNRKKNEYDWLIILESEKYYAKCSFEELIDWLKHKQDAIITIENLKWLPELQYQIPKIYHYYNTGEFIIIIAEYKDSKGVSIKKENINTNQIIWKSWRDGLLTYARNDMGIIFMYPTRYGIYHIQYNYKDNEWITTKMVPPYQKRMINDEDIKHIRKILTRMGKCDDFYKEDIEIVNNLLGL